VETNKIYLEEKVLGEGRVGGEREGDIAPLSEKFLERI